jgi:uncharacterized membrane protein (UPF0127 family)
MTLGTGRKNHWQKRVPKPIQGFEAKHLIAKQPKQEFALVRADTCLVRVLGLLGERTIAPTHALWLKPCSGVHTFGMQCSIGVFFIDKKGAVVKTIAQLKPNRIAFCWQARSVVETAAFANQQTDAMTLAVMRALAQVRSP